MNVPPYKIKEIEPLSRPSAKDRRSAFARAGYNTFLLRSEDVFIDLLTDSGTGAVSQDQDAASRLGDEAYAGSRSFYRLEEAMREIYGYRHCIPTHQGRGGEHLLARALVGPGKVVPSNLYFTTSRAHVELQGGAWADVAIPEAHEPATLHSFKGNIDCSALKRVLDGAGTGGIAFVRIEASVNMAGGQPFSLENLREVRRLTERFGVPLVLDGTRVSENALFIKDREEGYAKRTLARIVREIAGLTDVAVFSSKKGHYVPIGGFVGCNDDALAQRLREDLVLFEGFPTYGGMSGAAMEALAQGVYESVDEPTVRHYAGQAAFLGSQLQERGVAIVLPVGGHAVCVDAKQFLFHLPQEHFPAQALAAAFYLAGGVRTMERGIVSGQHGKEPYRGLELVRLTIPRRVYTKEHLEYVVAVVAEAFRHRETIPGLRMTYEPKHLRFFQARFAPRGKSFPRMDVSV